jgi:lipopolysaccharide transport system permease protein
MLLVNKKITIYEPSYFQRKISFLHIKEIVTEIYNNKWLVYQFFKRDFIAIYKQTFLGVFWTIFTPLLSVSVFFFLNKAGIINIGHITVPYPLYAVFSIAYWQLFSTTVMLSSDVLVKAGSMLLKINFSKKSLVLASAGQAIFAFLVQFAMFIFLLIYYGFPLQYRLIFTTFFMLPLLFLALGLGFFLSILNAITREVGGVISVCLMFFLFVTPILYEKPVHGSLPFFATYNPVYHLVKVPRDIIIYGQPAMWQGYIYACLVSVLIFMLGITVFHLIEKRIAERI